MQSLSIQTQSKRSSAREDTKYMLQSSSLAEYVMQTNRGNLVNPASPIDCLRPNRILQMVVYQFD